LFEGLKAYRKTDGSILLFRPEENARRMIVGADRMCMPAPTVEQFMDAVKQTVLANKRWVRAFYPVLTLVVFMVSQLLASCSLFTRCLLLVKVPCILGRC
jgi:branched-subunit amino acid aminotransferase/4-amino-4-deoxychorismate lyase